jgi:uncharacterized protein
MSDEALPLPLPEPAALEPVKRQERIAAMDVLRGIAVLGIFLINMPLFVAPSDAFFLWDRNVLWTKEADRLASLFVWIFAQGKFYTIFCFLFGAGFALQWRRLDALGFDFVNRLHRRRMYALLGIGILHFVFIWWGDILHLYALIGLLLPGLLWVEDKNILLTAVVLTLVPLAISMAWETRSRDAVHNAQASAARTTRTVTDIKIMSRGGFSDILKHRLQRDAGQLLFETWWAFRLLPAFLLGFVAARRRLFTETRKHRRLLLALALAALPVGLAITAGDLWWDYQNSLTEPPLWKAELGMIREFIGRPAMAYGYVAILLLIGARAWMAPFAAVGRMALTNYLLQSLVFTTIANSYGLGLYGRVRPTQGLLWCLGFYVLQMIGSMLWLRWNAYGPVEWVWRRLTYGRV